MIPYKCPSKLTNRQCYFLPGTYNWKSPYNVFVIKAIIIGAGAGCYSGNVNCGGGAGGLAICFFECFPNYNYTLIVGKGGNPSTSGTCSSIYAGNNLLVQCNGGTDWSGGSVVSNINTILSLPGGNGNGGGGGGGIGSSSTSGSGGGGAFGGYALNHAGGIGLSSNGNPASLYTPGDINTGYDSNNRNDNNAGHGGYQNGYYPTSINNYAGLIPQVQMYYSIFGFASGSLNRFSSFISGSGGNSNRNGSYGGGGGANASGGDGLIILEW